MNANKLLILASLYVAQFLPTTFFIQVVPVLMRQQKMSLEQIGLLGFLVIPSALKFLWSPLIDRYRLRGLGHYRGWILLFHGLLIATIFGISFLEVERDFSLLFVGMFLTFLFAASQDIATDAVAVNLLTPQERGIGNAIQASGNFLGAILGGGVVLILFDRIGWQQSLWMIAIALFLCLIPMLFYQEAPPAKSLTLNCYQPFVRFFSRPKMWLWIVVVLLYMVGENVSTTLIRPLLVDRGLSLAEIGQLLGVMSYLARIVGALVAGAMITQWSKTTARAIVSRASLIRFGVVSNVAMLLYILPAIGVAQPFVLYAICIAVSGLQSMAYTALLAAMMDRSQAETAATDYTTQISAVFLGTMATTILGGRFAQESGYVITFIVSMMISLIAIALIPKTDPV
jgi:MFS family permease